MPETKIGLSQVERPAPQWYRRLQNGFIIFLIPGASALAQSWGFTDHQLTRILAVLTFIPAILKGIGVFLGNGQNYTESAKSVLIIIGTVAILSGCNSVPKARSTFERNPDAFADLSAKYYPCIPDSVGKIPVFRPADNKDHSPEIEKVHSDVDSLKLQLEHARKYAADSISKKCADLVSTFQNRTNKLLYSIDSLKRTYKPCLPDSVPVPYPVRSTAEMALITQLKEELNKKQATIADQNHTLIVYKVIGWICIIVAIVYIFLTIKKLFQWR
ncbi:hypothetical protein ACE38W_00420 [Chitinophaga sp. Hz27]|uniref:hypothetical protein n=1 Tax=Chitinophaga sp. Hz27 TaxID=3347169 RepID=UPI0035DCAAD5